jgi:hypothetical protein
MAPQPVTATKAAADCVRLAVRRLSRYACSWASVRGTSAFVVEIREWIPARKRVAATAAGTTTTRRRTTPGQASTDATSGDAGCSDGRLPTEPYLQNLRRLPHSQ